MRSMAGPGSKFAFPDSGNETAATNLGHICLIGFELFEMSRDELDSDDNEADVDEWLGFCKTTIYKTTRRWERRLEDTDSEGEDPPDTEKPAASDGDEREDNDEADSFENNFDRFFNGGAEMSRQGRSHVAICRPDIVAADLSSAAEKAKPKSKDDSELTEEKEFGNNNYWRLPEPLFEDLVLE